MQICLLPAIKKLKQWFKGMKFHPVYGTTETSSPATVMPGDVYEERKLGSSGIPYQELKLKLLMKMVLNYLLSDWRTFIKETNIMMRYLHAEQNDKALLTDGLKQET